MPRILVAYVMPDDESRWLEQTDYDLPLRPCAWWTSLRGSPRTENARSIRVSLPSGNRFDFDAVRGPLRHLALRGMLS